MKSYRLMAVIFAMTLPFLALANPIMVYNDNQTAIFGTGNPDTGWTTSLNADRGVSVSLRAKNRTNGSTANDGAGNYSFATAPAPRGLWNYEFSFNSGSNALTAFEFYLSADRDSSQGILYSTIKPLDYWFDNSFGTTATLNGQGVEGLAAVYASLNTIAQNSQNLTFGGLTGYPGGAMPLEANATYTYTAFAVEAGAGINGARLAQSTINVIVGAGGAPVQNVPDAGSSAAMFAMALGGIVTLNRRFKKAAVA